MCVAIYQPMGTKLSAKRLSEAYRANPDGCGFMWVSDGMVISISGLYEFEFFWALYLRVFHSGVKTPFVLHFRTASASAIGKEYCHPFMVNENLAFVQNGNLYEFSDYFPGRKQDGKSDVQRFKDECLKRVDAPFSSAFINILEKYSRECLSKFIFLDSSGKVTIINESAGEWQDGIWYSNGGIDNYVGYGYSGAYYYREGDIRHKGGLMSVRMLGGKRKSWNQCPTCQGWFKNLEGNCSGCETYLELMSYV